MNPYFSYPSPRHPIDAWHLPNGVGIWDAGELRQPCAELDERDGALRVVLLADYEALSRLFDEALGLLEDARNPDAAFKEGLPRAIERILAAVA